MILQPLKKASHPKPAWKKPRILFYVGLAVGTCMLLCPLILHRYPTPAPSPSQSDAEPARRLLPSQLSSQSHESPAGLPDTSKNETAEVKSYLKKNQHGQTPLHLLSDQPENKPILQQIVHATEPLLEELLEPHTQIKDIQKVIISYLPAAPFLSIEDERGATPLDGAQEGSPFYRLMQQHGAIHSQARIHQEIAATWGASRGLNAALALEALAEANTHDLWLLLSAGVGLQEMRELARTRISPKQLQIPKSLNEYKNPFQVATSLIEANWPSVHQRLQVGFNMRGVCPNENCAYHNQLVYYHECNWGKISLADFVGDAPCPSCWETLDEANINAFRLYRCRYSLVGRPAGKPRYYKDGIGTYRPDLHGTWRYLSITLSPIIDPLH